jgi:hypothetical protein
VQLSAAVAASGALALGLTTVIGSGSPAPAAGTIRTAAFTLARNANGTASLTLNQDQVFDPATLQQALARDGIPALVRSGTYCTSTPAPPSSGVVSIQLPDGSPVPVTGRRSPIPPDAVTVINPAAMPARAGGGHDTVARPGAQLLNVGEYCVHHLVGRLPGVDGDRPECAQAVLQYRQLAA